LRLFDLHCQQWHDEQHLDPDEGLDICVVDKGFDLFPQPFRRFSGIGCCQGRIAHLSLQIRPGEEALTVIRFTGWNEYFRYSTPAGNRGTQNTQERM
jgi:hypothetical protein